MLFAEVVGLAQSCVSWHVLPPGSLFLSFLVQDVVCPEAVKLDDIDSAAVSSQYESAKSAYNGAAAGSLEQAEAQIAMEVNRAMGIAIGLTLS